MGLVEKYDRLEALTLWRKGFSVCMWNSYDSSQTSLHAPKVLKFLGKLRRERGLPFPFHSLAPNMQ